MRVGQPGMQRPHWHFDGEGGSKSQKEPKLNIGRNSALRNQIRHREGLSLNAQPKNGKQHQDGTSHRIQEELDGGIDTARSAPNADKEIHGDKREFPEDIKEE